jgi:hypothetical protein
MKYLKYFAVLPLMAALFFVAGCATRVTSDVARFHRLPKPNGETFQIEPKDKAKLGSLEFNQYAGLVGDKLVDVGYQATPQGQKPDLIVRLDYGVSNGQVRVNSYPSMGGYGYPYGYSRWWNSYFYDPFYPYGFGYEPEIRSEVYYVRRLSMDIARGTAGDSGKEPEKLFEGRVESEGTDNRMPEVMPYLVKAMFDNFPGPSGVTQHIVIEKEKQGNY